MSKGSTYRYKEVLKGRYFFVFFFITLSFALLLSRLFYLQVLKHDRYSDAAKNSKSVVIPLTQARGLILDRNGSELAVNVWMDSVYAVPRVIADKPAVARQLADILGKDRQEILNKISNDKLFVWISRKAGENICDRIRAAGIEGVGFARESERMYPNKSLAAHVLGFADIDNNGLEGVEKRYDKELRGRQGYKVAVVDAKRRQVSSIEERYLPPLNGYDIVLTIDAAIQHIAEEAMAAAVKKYKCKSGSIIVMDPVTGEVLAMCNWPAFDANDHAAASSDDVRNRAVTDINEPGSSFKIVTASAVLEERLVGLEDEFFCENGEYRVGGHILHDHRPHGVLRFKNIIELSSNIGTVKVAQLLGKTRLYKYTRLFGFGDPTGIDLPGEVKGIIAPISKWSNNSMYAIPIGQEVASTTLQLAAAISCIANDGLLVRPRVVKMINDGSGAKIKESDTKFVRRAISTETSLQMKKILRMAVETGTGTNAKLRGYTAAGKTGTAQRLEDDGSYSHSKFNSVFIGFAPVYKPRLAIAVFFVEPRPYYFGGTVAAPVFSEIADKALRYMGVPADAPTGKKDARKGTI